MFILVGLLIFLASFALKGRARYYTSCAGMAILVMEVIEVLINA